MLKRQIKLERIADPKARKMIYAKRKNGLMRRAMELSVLCDCEVAVIVYDCTGKLCQYSSVEMEELLSRYSKTCTEPHECHSTEELYRHYLLSKLSAQDVAPSRKRQRSMPYILAAAAAVAERELWVQQQQAEEEEEEEDREEEGQRPSTGDDSAAQQSLLELSDMSAGKEGPGRLAGAGGCRAGPFSPPVSPRSAHAFGRIHREFDRLLRRVEVEMETAAAMASVPSPAPSMPEQLLPGEAPAPSAALGLEGEAAKHAQQQRQGGQEGPQAQQQPAAARPVVGEVGGDTPMLDAAAPLEAQEGHAQTGTPTQQHAGSPGKEQQALRDVTAQEGTPPRPRSTGRAVCPGAPVPPPLLAPILPQAAPEAGPNPPSLPPTLAPTASYASMVLQGQQQGMPTSAAAAQQALQGGLPSTSTPPQLAPLQPPATSLGAAPSPSHVAFTGAGVPQQAPSTDTAPPAAGRSTPSVLTPQMPSLLPVPASSAAGLSGGGPPPPPPPPPPPQQQLLVLDQLMALQPHAQQQPPGLPPLPAPQGVRSPATPTLGAGLAPHSATSAPPPAASLSLLTPQQLLVQQALQVQGLSQGAAIGGLPQLFLRPVLAAAPGGTAGTTRPALAALVRAPAALHHHHHQQQQQQHQAHGTALAGGGPGQQRLVFQLQPSHPFTSAATSGAGAGGAGTGYGMAAGRGHTLPGVHAGLPPSLITLRPLQQPSQQQQQQRVAMLQPPVGPSPAGAAPPVGTAVQEAGPAVQTSAHLSSASPLPFPPSPALPPGTLQAQGVAPLPPPRRHHPQQANTPALTPQLYPAPPSLPPASASSAGAASASASASASAAPTPSVGGVPGGSPMAGLHLALPALPASAAHAAGVAAARPSPPTACSQAEGGVPQMAGPEGAACRGAPASPALPWSEVLGPLAGVSSAAAAVPLPAVSDPGTAAVGKEGFDARGLGTDLPLLPPPQQEHPLGRMALA